VYTCTHCDRKGYLTKFYFNKVNFINFANKNVWVHKSTNPQGHKKVWVLKGSPVLFDVGVSSQKTWESWCLNGRCAWSLTDNKIKCTTIKELKWDDHIWFGEMKLALLVPETIYVFHLSLNMLWLIDYKYNLFVYMFKCKFYKNLIYLNNVWDTLLIFVSNLIHIFCVLNFSLFKCVYLSFDGSCIYICILLKFTCF